VKDRANEPGSGAASHPPSTTHPSLLDGLRRADPGTWQRLARLYGPLVYGWCRKRGLPAVDAEDLLQEVFLVVAARVADFRREKPGDTFRGWLWGITRHKVGDWLRRRKREAQAAGGSDAARRLAELPEPDVPEEEPDGGRSAGLCLRALELIRPEFKEQTWQAFWQVTTGGRDPAAVAAELGMSRNAVYIAKARILARLHEVLGEESAHRARPPGAPFDSGDVR
jgi:RNA polymerase sigma-70 factor (ECF subfamily)